MATINAVFVLALFCATLFVLFTGSLSNAENNVKHDEALEELMNSIDKKVLGEIYDKMDTDTDRKVTSDEIVSWMKEVQRKNRRQNAKSELRDMHFKEDTIKWGDFLKHAHPVIFDPKERNEYDTDASIAEEQKSADRYRRRWLAADEDEDDQLDLDEFGDFLRPFEVPRLRKIYLQEQLEEEMRRKPNMDEDDQEYYLEDLERELLAGNYDGVNAVSEAAEAKELIAEADEDGDGVVSKDEVMKKHLAFGYSHVMRYYHDDVMAVEPASESRLD